MSALLVGATALAVLAKQESDRTAQELATLRDENIQLIQLLGDTQIELSGFKSADLVIQVDNLRRDMEAIKKAFNDSIPVFENVVDLRDRGVKTATLETDFAKILKFLADANYASASSATVELATKVKAEETKLAAARTTAGTPVASVESNTPPGSGGYQRQAVKLDIGTYTVSIVGADLGSHRMIVDTASDSDCGNNCPVLPLASYVARNGAVAGINGTYFCPASYPTCAGKTNTFDLLVMNKNKHYFNSDNNVYSTNPAVIAQSGSLRFVGQALQWGRDTGVDAVLSNYPLLVSGGQVVFGGDSDPKSGAKGGRSFVANKGSTAYIGVVHSATIAESARVLQALGMENALNLDDGGSTALWAAGGYKAGPGRELPNAILFVRK